MKEVSLKQDKEQNVKVRKFANSILRNWQLYLLVLPGLIYFIIFAYGPMYGIQIAFKNYMVTKGIWGSPWVGLKHFKRFFNGYYAGRLIWNTLKINICSLIFGFPLPIIFALMLNELRSKRYKKIIQTVSYAPHFISTVVVVSMVTLMLSPSNGVINAIIQAFGGEAVYFMAEEGWFVPIYVISGIWQGLGWGSIVYIAALTNVDQEVQDAARVDGASRMQRILHVNIPCIMPTIIIMLINQVGHLMSVGFEKVLLMQNSLNAGSSDVISTYTYRSGLINGEFSYSTAIGLFNSVINFILLISVNKISKKLSDTSLW